MSTSTAQTLSLSDIETLYAEEIARRDEQIAQIPIFFFSRWDGIPNEATLRMEQLIGDNLHLLTGEHGLTDSEEKKKTVSVEGKKFWDEKWNEVVNVISAPLRIMHRKWHAQKAIPELFAAPINRARLNNIAAHDAVMCYDLESARGLFCHGASGQGKTRAVYARLLEFAAHYRQLPFTALTEANLRLKAQHCSKQHTSLAEDVGQINVLFVDDFGKAAITSAYQEQLHELLDYRTREALPTIVTSQYDEDALLVRLSGFKGKNAEWAEGIMRRISDADFADVINFDHAQHCAPTTNDEVNPAAA